jgi:nucleotide-binding universal stress UspA family protein
VVPGYPRARDGVVDVSLMETQMHQVQTGTSRVETTAFGGWDYDQCIVRIGNPYHEIVVAAKEMNMDLIILSTHGRTGLKYVFMGSTAEHVVRYAPCPVLVVREHEHEFVSNKPSA